jgi:uncharacterized protein
LKGKRALIIFAREPEDGKVKTRLLTHFDAAAVTGLYKAFIQDVVHTARQVRCDEKFLYYTGSDQPWFLQQFQDDFCLRPQSGADLGERMAHAVCACQSDGFVYSVIIGTDCPSLTFGQIQQAFEELEECDLVLGPSPDGGYYLIGQNMLYPRLYSNIEWGTDNVFNQTLKRAKELQLNVTHLSPQQDVDVYENLKDFVSDSAAAKTAPRGFECVQQLLKDKK